MTTEDKCAIIVDSCGDISLELAQELGIRILPVHIMYPEKDYLDGIDIDPLMVYERFPDEFPYTSTPSFGEVHAMFEELIEEGYNQAIFIHISSKLSSTVNTVRLVAAEFEDRIAATVYDTKNISIGSGMLAIWAATKRNEGMPYAEISEKLEEKRYDSHLVFLVETLDYLHKGGRIGKVGYFITSHLHIKPLITCNKDGVYESPAKVRSKKKGYDKILELAASCAIDKPCWISVQHGGDPEGAKKMLEKAKEMLPQAKVVLEKQITASMAVHTGPGLVGLAVLVEP